MANKQVFNALEGKFDLVNDAAGGSSTSISNTVNNSKVETDPAATDGVLASTNLTVVKHKLGSFPTYSTIFGSALTNGDASLFDDGTTATFSGVNQAGNFAMTRTLKAAPATLSASIASTNGGVINLTGRNTTAANGGLNLSATGAVGFNGRINMQFSSAHLSINGVVGAAGTVLTSGGAGVPPTWSVVTGFANTSLSNLSGTTAVNQDIVPATDNTRSLGSSTLRFGNLFAATVNNSTMYGNTYFASGHTLHRFFELDNVTTGSIIQVISPSFQITGANGEILNDTSGKIQVSITEIGSTINKRFKEFNFIVEKDVSNVSVLSSSTISDLTVSNPSSLDASLSMVSNDVAVTITHSSATRVFVRVVVSGL